MNNCPVKLRSFTVNRSGQCSSISAILNSNSFYIRTANLDVADALEIPPNKLKGCTVPWDESPEHAQLADCLNKFSCDI